jgi:lipopolysaccharide/colanic/teichoic acid biosynthesis glycosyltransferase
MLKFRTMRVGCTGPEFTVAEDPRITKLGAILRKTKLDELPQLVNVLRGEMSLVGPRPQSLSLAEHYREDELSLILSVRPGLTGPTQLWLRKEEELLARQEDPARFYVDELLPMKVASDIAYVERRNLWLDAKVVISTVRAVASLPDSEGSKVIDLRPVFDRTKDIAA